MAQGGRKTQYQAMHQISAALNSLSAASGIVGVLPAGAIMGGVHSFELAAFNSTTNTVALGTTPGGVQLLAATDLKTLGRTDAAVPSPTCGPLGVDTPIYYTLVSTGPPSTLGLAVVMIDYLPGPG